MRHETDALQEAEASTTAAALSVPIQRTYQTDAPHIRTLDTQQNDETHVSIRQHTLVRLRR